MRSLALFLAAAFAARPQTAPQRNARDIFKELIEINTTDSSGDCTKAASAMAARFREAGFPSADVRLLGPHPKKQNLVVRLRGTGRAKPILLISHTDVVEARASDWSMNPFQFIEKDGYFYGRGTQDMKGDAAVFVETLLRFKQEGWKPSRDLILALTPDEEGGNYDGVKWLVENHRDLIEAEYCVNPDSGGGQIRKGKHVAFTIGAAEKVYVDFTLEASNPGGHSSMPVKDNAIYRMSAALGRLSGFEFPVRLNEVTRMFLDRSARLSSGQEGQDMKAILKTPPEAAAVERLSRSPYYNALLRTTCVATMIEGGHARNALPQKVTANVNCRLLPDESADDVRATLARVVNDAGIAISLNAPPKPSPPSPLTPAILRPVERTVREVWGAIPVIPVMDTGASDGLFLRRAGMPVYGISGIFSDVDDVRAHGRDERILVKSFYDDVDFMYKLLKELAR